MPGTRYAIAELRLHAERDADQWALRQHHDPLALASAICKAAIDRTLPPIAFASLGGSGGVDRRLDELTAVEPQHAGLRRRSLRLVAAGVVAVTVAVIAIVPAATAAALGEADTSAKPPAERHCVA